MQWEQRWRRGRTRGEAGKYEKKKRKYRTEGGNHVRERNRRSAETFQVGGTHTKEKRKEKRN